MDELVVAYSGNLSRGALFLATDALSPPGSVVRVHVELPGEAAELTVACRVAFVRSAADEHGPAGMGVKFIDPDDLVRRRLEWIILNSAPDPHQIVEPRARRSLDVVVVDDDPLQAQAAAAPFRQRNDTVRIARDGLEGLAFCLKQRPDVVLSDVEMPRMDGWQMLRMLRARPQLTAVPVLLLTRLSGEDARLQGYRLGVDDYLGKPPEPSDLVARVDRAVVRAEQQARATASAEPNALRGDLEQVSLASVLSFLEIEKRTGVLTCGPIVQGRIWLRDGLLVGVEIEESEQVSQEDCVFRLLDQTVGRFEFATEPVTAPARLSTTITRLLLEHARRHDEG